MQGKVKWFNTKKGFGFIEAGDGDSYFAHYNDIKGQEGFKNLVEGQNVSFDGLKTEKGLKAVNIIVA